MRPRDLEELGIPRSYLLHLVRRGTAERIERGLYEILDTDPICLVACQRSPEPVFLKWKGTEESEVGDFFVRSGPGTVKLSPDDVREYVATRFPKSKPAKPARAASASEVSHAPTVLTASTARTPIGAQR